MTNHDHLPTRISDMNPVRRAQHIANKYGEVFRNPIDEVDGAARYLQD